MTETTLVILTRNEIKGLQTLIDKIPFDAVDEYFAVDYQSTDGTVELFRKFHVKVIKQKNPGRGIAFTLAAQHARGKYLIFFSPDGNEDPKDITKLIALMKKGADLAIASRFMKGARNEEDNKRLKFRKWANQIFTFIANICWHGHVTDTINGYRAITKELFEKINLDASGFAVEYQMTIRAIKLRAKIAEIPTIESDRIGGQSTAIAIPTGIAFVKLLIKEIIVGKRFLKR